MHGRPNEIARRDICFPLDFVHILKTIFDFLKIISARFSIWKSILLPIKTIQRTSMYICDVLDLLSEWACKFHYCDEYTCVPYLLLF